MTSFRSDQPSAILLQQSNHLCHFHPVSGFPGAAAGAFQPATNPAAGAPAVGCSASSRLHLIKQLHAQHVLEGYEVRREWTFKDEDGAAVLG